MSRPLLALFLCAAAGGILAGGRLPSSGALDPSAPVPRALIERFDVDSELFDRRHPLRLSSDRQAQLQRFLDEWAAQVAAVPFDRTDQDGRIDLLLLRSLIEERKARLPIETARRQELAPWIPFAEPLLALEESRLRMEPADGRAAAAVLDRARTQVEELLARVESGRSSGSRPAPSLAARAAAAVDSVRGTVRSWTRFYQDYDPVVTWWIQEPAKSLDGTLLRYATTLRRRFAGVADGDTTTIVGDPIGREALLAELRAEWIPYTPEELLEIAKRELAWCESEMRRASRELGYGDDWKRALEHVKERHVEPGQQPALIRELALEAIQFVKQRDLVTVPELAETSWRMEMMAPERQLVNPFFTGGEVITVSYPTAGMTHEAKRMGMRGNNRHFSRATVHHELIPGHHLQGFMARRHRPYRSVFRTPFLIEGWPLYWEMLLWDLDFARSPEDRVGMLFWRMHRCARIQFSLGFHTGKMSPEECIRLLVDRVGHERANAEAEVRRSLNGSYPPLYQAAYMLGGLQLRALHRELVGSGKMSNREFHDAVLRENSIPVELIRASLTRASLRPDARSSWRFYPGLP